VLKYLNKKSNGKIRIIGVGGIFDTKNIKEKLNVGTSLVQI